MGFVFVLLFLVMGLSFFFLVLFWKLGFVTLKIEIVLREEGN